MQVILSGPIQAIKGTLDKQSGAYFTTRNGKTFLCFRKHNTAPRTQQPTQQRFTQMQTLTSEILKSPTLKAVYQKQFKRQKKYATLRGFVAHMAYQIIKQQNL